MENLIILDAELRNFPSSNRVLKWLYGYLENKYLKIIYFFAIPKIKKYIKKGNTKIIAFDKRIGVILEQKKIPFSSFKDYYSASDYEKYERESIKYIRKLPKSFPEINIKYEGVSLWECEELDIFWSFLGPLITNIEILNKIIDIEKPKNIILFDSGSKVGSLIKQFNHKVKIIDKTNLFSKIKTQITNVFTPFIIKTINSDFIKKIKSAKYNPKQTKEIIYFEDERGFFYSKSFLRKLKKKITILQDGKYNLKEKGFDYDFLANHINKTSKNKLLSFKKTLIHHLHTLMESKEFKNNFKYKEIRIFDSLKDMIQYLFLNAYFRSSFYYECLNNFLIKGKPQLIIFMSEASKDKKIILNLSKKYGIKSLFMMHGIFGITSYWYEHLLSDILMVYGLYYKNVLVNLGNEKKKIIVTGNPSWDHLAKTHFNEQKIISDLNLPKDKKIILFVTFHFPLDLRDRLAHAIMKSMKKLPDYYLVIKLHPEERPDFYNKLLKKYGLKATIFEEVSLLPSLIKISELVIALHSTVGLETLILDKPLIVVDLAKIHCYSDQVAKGVALGIENEEDLLPAMKSLLEDGKLRQKLRKNREKYVYEHAYKQDGKATERVIKVIKNIIKSK